VAISVRIWQKAGMTIALRNCPLTQNIDGYERLCALNNLFVLMRSTVLAKK
jgi:hypothetical protein